MEVFSLFPPIVYKISAGMKFQVQPIIEGKLTRLQVELISSAADIEQFRVIGKNKTVILQTNRLLFQNRGLKHRKPQWKVIDGSLNNPYNMEKITDAIEAYLSSGKKEIR